MHSGKRKKPYISSLVSSPRSALFEICTGFHSSSADSINCNSTYLFITDDVPTTTYYDSNYITSPGRLSAICGV